MGGVSKSLNHIHLGRRTHQNFVNLSLGQFVEKLSYKLEQQGIELAVANESYTSKASFVDNDEMPKKRVLSVVEVYAKNAEPTYSDKRIKRGLYQSQNGKFLNADVSGYIRLSVFLSSNSKVYPHELAVSFVELTEGETRG